MRLVRTFAGIYRALSHFERVARNRGLVLLFIAWLSVAVISSTALYLAEADINPNIHSPMNALWWGIVTSGLITDDEFQAKKRELLDRM